MPTSVDSFKSRAILDVAGRKLRIHRLAAVAEAGAGDVKTLPHVMKILLENLLRHEDGEVVTKDHVRAVAAWDPAAAPTQEIAFTPARILLQDFTGVPAVVDLAAFRDAFARMGGDPSQVNPLLPADLVIDHSVQVDEYGTPQAFERNAKLELERNRERYELLRWGQGAFDNFRVVPPDTGIVHQVNLEHLASAVFVRKDDDGESAYPDTLVGTDSHTTMVNGLGVLGWGVGGIEAEAAMLGEPVGMLLPEVVGMELTGALAEGATATDLVLTVTQLLRREGVVGKFVEFFGPGLDSLSLPDRATIANMCPEYGATVGHFPIDDETLAYLRFTGRDERHVALVEKYAREQGLFRDDAVRARYSRTLSLSLGSVEPSLAGPKRPQDRVPLSQAKQRWRRALVELVGHAPKDEPARQTLDRWLGEGGTPCAATSAPTEGAAPAHVPEGLGRTASVDMGDGAADIGHGAVVIAAITSCTNTSNPAVMLAAGLLARKAVARGLRAKPWVKTSLAPGSQVVTEYLRRAELLEPLETLGFHLVGYGCTTCIGNSGPLPGPVAEAVRGGDLVAAAVLSGNRNFEGRINPLVRANYLASPPLCVAYAIAGRMDFDPLHEPLGNDAAGVPVFLRDVWPSIQEVRDTLRTAVTSDMFRRVYADVLEGGADWRALEVPQGRLFRWDAESTYCRQPPFFEAVVRGEPPARSDIADARVLCVLGDSVTTDHISPAGNIPAKSPAGQYLQGHGVEPKDFNSYGARRGNHEVMVRGTFANIRLRNLLAPGTEGGVTRHLPSGDAMTIFDAAMRYRDEGVPLIVLAGKEYGSGSSRDWAAKGPQLLGVKAVLAESYERIHRSNLIGMGILPLQYRHGESRDTLGLSGEEVLAVEGVAKELRPGQELTVRASGPSGTRTFSATARLDTAKELDYFEHGGILPYVLRRVARR